MASVARCSTENCHAPAVVLCSRCQEPVCGYHATINEVCFECVLGMDAATAEVPAGNGPAIIWWMD